jgi:hypothetical protein
MIKSKHDVGGKVLRTLPIWMRPEAVFGGSDGEYRYTLERLWDASLPTVMFLMMNPSTASNDGDDPTVAKCTRYAEKWGFGELLVGNAFAYRTTDQRRLMVVADPIGPDNDIHLKAMAQRSSMIVFAYGKPNPSLRYRGPAVASMLSDGGKRPIHFLKLCKDGTPSHPLYLLGDLKPTLWDTKYFA